jgi:hypothetical protein
MLYFGNSHGIYYIFSGIVNEIEVSVKEKKLDFSLRKEEYVKVRIFTL